nr:ribonuclease J [Clostridiales bacterium]
IYVKENEDIIDKTLELVRDILANNDLKGENWPELKNILKDEVHAFIFEKIKRNPMILPIILDI